MDSRQIDLRYRVGGWGAWAAGYMSSVFQWLPRNLNPRKGRGVLVSISALSRGCSGRRLSPPTGREKWQDPVVPINPQPFSGDKTRGAGLLRAEGRRAALNRGGWVSEELSRCRGGFGKQKWTGPKASQYLGCRGQS